MVSFSVCIDVSNKSTAVDFYTGALGMKYETDNGDYVSLSADGVTVYLSEKAEGTNPLLEGHASRSYQRHWTPVHLDFHVTNVDVCVARIVELGGKNEGSKSGEWGKAVFCSDPFGNGFCVLQLAQ